MIAREGLVFILIGLTLTAVFLYGATRWSSSWLFSGSVLFGVLTLFCVYFFRDPERTTPLDEDALVSPADGRVVQIVTLDRDPFVGAGAVRVSIFLSVFDVHVNRVPSSGTVDFVRYNPGKFFAAYEDKASSINEQTEIGMTCTNGGRLVVKQIAGLIARRIVCKLSEGDTVVAGERFGLIRFGSRVDLVVPADSEIEVEIGDHVTGGETVLARLRVEQPTQNAAQPQESTDGH